MIKKKTFIMNDMTLNRVILLVISSIGNAPTLADLFEGGGLSMDLFTSHESGREENFLVDLFVLLVISLHFLYDMIFIICDTMRNSYYIGTNYDSGWIDQSTPRSMRAHRSSSKAAARFPTIHVLERLIARRHSRTSDRAFTFSTTTSHSESSGLRGRYQ